MAAVKGTSALETTDRTWPWMGGATNSQYDLTHSAQL